MNIESVLAMPIRALEKSSKRIRFALADGTPFHLVGGKDQRPLETGVAGFTPAEMILVLNSRIDEESFKATIKIKKVFGGGVVDVEPCTQEGQVQEIS